jgi:aryl sulfotransferase
MAALDAQTHRRYIKTHLPLDGLPYSPDVKYIVVGRDARDVFMSYWNHYSSHTDAFYRLLNDELPGRVGAPLPRCPQDIHECWHNWITRGWFAWESEGYPHWGNLRHTQSWWNYRHLDNLLFVHYGDLLTDLTGEIERIADFLDITASVATIASVTERVSLTAMRREAEARGGATIFKGGAVTFFYKGANGRWKDVLSAAELDLYHAAVARELTPNCAAWLEAGRQAW